MDGMEHDLVRLQHIVSVARERRFVRAAAALGISQPALSRSIRMFEEKHRIRIFDRGRGGVVPTAAGVQVIREAETILRSLRELHHHVRLYGEQGSGLIRIIVVPMLSSLILPSLSQLVLRPGQQALLEAIVPSLDHFPAMLLDERNELAFCAAQTAANRPGLVIEPLGKLAICALVRAGHPLLDAEEVSISALVEYPTLCIADLSNSRTDSKVGGVVCSDVSVLRDATLASDGVWIASPSLVRSDLQEGRLHKLAIAGFVFEECEICVAYRQGRTLSKLARLMITDVRRVLAEQ